ncbi:chorismate mutase [Rhodococcus sp. HNM0569]|nr:chorismate mutase [Rhodococcus sp. HNM0569]
MPGPPRLGIAPHITGTAPTTRGADVDDSKTVIDETSSAPARVGGPDIEATLEELRAQLDRVDRALLDDIRDRMLLCARVAQVKRQHAIAVVQPGRMRTVHHRAREYADRHGLSAEFVRALYDLLIDEACRVEDRIVDDARPGGTRS